MTPGEGRGGMVKAKGRQKAADAPAIKPMLIDHREVAALLGVPVSTWLDRVKRGEAPVPHSRMGKFTYYRAKAVEHFVEHGTWPEGTKFNGRGGI